MPDGKKKTVDELLNDLKSANVHLQKKAVQALQCAEAQEDILKIVRMLQDQSWHFRTKLEDVLGVIGSTALKSLITAARTGVWYVRASAASALGKMRDTGSMGVLEELLSDRTDAVRKAAMNALTEMVDRNNAFAYAAELENIATSWREQILGVLEKKDESLHMLLIRILSGEEKPPVREKKEGMTFKLENDMAEGEPENRAVGESSGEDIVLRKFRKAVNQLAEDVPVEEVS